MEESDVPAGMSVITRDVDALEEFSPGGGLPDVESLLSDWQEQLAIADDGSNPIPSSSEQEAMMAKWRALIDSKETELRRVRRKELRKAYDGAAVPAHLTAWWSAEDDGGLDSDLGAEVEEEEGEVAAVEALLEAEAEGADDADDAFVRAWQSHAESDRENRERQAARKKLGSRAPEEVQKIASWLFQGGKLKQAAPAEPAIGIDLGTTNCACAAVDPSTGHPFIIPAADGARISPSVVSFVAAASAGGASAASSEGAEELPTPLLLAGKATGKATGKTAVEGAVEGGAARVLVGAKAQRQRVTNPHSTYSSTKRLIGRTATSSELRALAALDVPHTSLGAEGAREVLLACPALARAISPVDAAAELVRSLVVQAEATLGHAVSRAVVTVPAYFDDSQRLATETACLLSGLQEVKLLREPEAAALTYALDQQADSRVMVFDLGGGTFDVSILDVGSGVVEVIASAGDPRLGGDDWDHTIAQWLEDAFVQEHGVPVDGFGRRRLLDAAEEAKLHLSTHATTTVDVPFLAGDKGLTVTLSRRKFEALCRPLLLRLVPAMREAAGMAGLELDESNWGTLTRGDLDQAPQGVQQWQKTVAWRWRRMARRAGSTTAASFPLGDVPISKVLLVGGATRMPCIGRFIKRVTGLTALPDTRVNPDESVALGAAVMAGVLDGTVKQTVLRNPYQHSRAASKLADDILKPRDVYDI